MTKTKVERIYDKYAKGYSTGHFAPETFDTARAAMSFADDITWHFLKKYLPENKSVWLLDAGAGDGFWAQRLIEMGYGNIVLVDISEGMLDEAKKRLSKVKFQHAAQFIKADIVDMRQLGSRTFDYVFSQYDAVSYCMRPRQAVKELARLAKRGAHVIVSLDTKYRRVPELIEAGQIKEAKELLRSNISYDFGHPQYNMTWEELSGYFWMAGLEVIEVVGTPVFMHQVNERARRRLEMDRKVREELLRIELLNCTNRTLVNFAGHLQIIGRKT